MTTEEKEGTNLILNFLNLEPNEGGEFEMYGFIESIEDKPRSKHFYFKSEMLFHSDWNWLMSVIERIETIEGNENFLEFTLRKKAKLQTNQEQVKTSKFDFVYLEVINFIKTYTANNIK